MKESVSVNVDKNLIVELCNQIKSKLIEKGKSRLIVYCAETNEDLDLSDIDDETLDELMEYYNEYVCSENVLVDYDCGGYDRTLQLDGIEIEDDILYFYLTEIEISNKGDREINTYKVDLDGLLNGRCWWMAGGYPVIEFRADEVLEFYVKLLSDDEFEFIV